MKKLADIAIVLAIISVVVGIISRLLVHPIAGIFASAFLQFSGVCLLLAIALLLREK
jgi:uncharacterized ion transporter superfamily protein YfcC